MLVQIEKIRENIEWRKWFDSLPLEEIVIVDEKGALFKPTLREVEEWEYTGLSNLYFFLDIANEGGEHVQTK